MSEQKRSKSPLRQQLLGFPREAFNRECWIYSIAGIDVRGGIVAAVREQQDLMAQLSECFAHLYDLHGMCIDRWDWASRKINDLHEL